MLTTSAVVAMAPDARADTLAQFDVTASIVPGCLVDGHGSSGNAGTIGRLDFGEDSTLSTDPKRAAIGQTVRLRCTPGVTLTMTVDGGRNAAGGARHLQLGGDTSARLPYTLCRDTACAQPIAIGDTALVQVSAANGQDVQLPVFGVLTLPGTLPPGTYSDMLTVTLAW